MLSIPGSLHEGSSTHPPRRMAMRRRADSETVPEVLVVVTGKVLGRDVGSEPKGMRGGAAEERGERALG